MGVKVGCEGVLHWDIKACYIEICKDVVQGYEGM